MGKNTQNLISKTRNKAFWRQLLAVLFLAIITGLLVVFTNFQVNAVFRKQERNFQLSTSLPTSQKPHPLPATLEKWQDKTNSGD
jgi:predicted Zn-dependent protease